jgi:hypothetical protein
VGETTYRSWEEHIPLICFLASTRFVGSSLIRGYHVEVRAGFPKLAPPKPREVSLCQALFPDISSELVASNVNEVATFVSFNALSGVCQWRSQAK